MSGWLGTPGPWHLGGRDERIVYDASGNAVLDTVTYHGRHSDEERAANSRAAAAIPDLVEGLIEARAYFAERADADLAPGDDSYTGNEEMRQMVAIDEKLARAGVRL